MKTGAIKKGFLAVMGAFLISSLSVVLVPFSVSKNQELNAAGYISGALFWIGLIAGSAGYFFLYYKNKGMILEKIQRPKWPGIVTFFSNTPGIVADVVLILSLAVSVYCTVRITVSPVISLTALFLLLISIYGHLIFNGKIYRYICQKK